MSSPAPSPLRQLDWLDRSSPEFLHQLDDVLHGQEYKQRVQNLQIEDSGLLVNYLDEVLVALDPSSSCFRKFIRELKRLCGTRGIVPTSYVVPTCILDINTNPFASGAYGDVHQGTLDGAKVCAKRVRVYTPEGVQKVIKAYCSEAATLKRLAHPNIAPLLGITFKPFQLISGWFPFDLPRYIEKDPDADRLQLLSDAATGLYYLHSCDVVHGDLKGTNILVNDSGRALIADFGLAIITRGVDSELSTTGDEGHGARWSAPEILTDQGVYSKEADVFSFAMVMNQVLNGAVPFHDKTPAAAAFAILKGFRPPRPKDPTVTEKLWILMDRSWAQEPHLRPDILEVLQGLRTPDFQTWRSPIDSSLTTQERIAQIEIIFSDPRKIQIVEDLSGGDAKVFVDAVYETSESLPQSIRERCLRTLSRICGRQALLPKSLEIPLCYDPSETPRFSSESADVWKGQYDGREVAAKALRVDPTGDPERVRKEFCREMVARSILRHPNVLPLLGVTITENRLVMVSDWMEDGNVDDFMKAHTDINRLKLLRDVTMGLIYMHDKGIVHGNLKGTNILIDHSGRACVADFGLHTVVPSSPRTFEPSSIGGGTMRWMGPELLIPTKFGLTESIPTKQSDCYALGMVIYEVLSGLKPFAPFEGPALLLKVLDGERPERPDGSQGVGFTDNIWWLLERCWSFHPDDRPRLKTVLRCLQESTSSSRSSYGEIYVETDSDDRSEDTSISDSAPWITHPTTQNPGLTITNSDCELWASSLCSSSKGYQYGDQPKKSPRAVNSKGRIGDRLLRRGRKIFRISIGKLCGLG